MDWSDQNSLRVPALTALAVLFCTATVALGAEEEIYPGDVGQMIAAIVVFSLLVLLLGRYAWKPIIKQLHNREERVRLSIEQAEKREEKAGRLLSDYEEKIAQAQQQAERIITDGRDEVRNMRDEVLSEARRESRKSVKRAREEIARAREEALRELRESTATLAVDVAERVLRRKLDQDEQIRLIDQSVEDVQQRVSEES